MATLDDLTVNVSSLEEAADFRRKAAARGQTFVLTNGCFDLLHAGHIYCLQCAAVLGDHLWVALNTDASVRCLKGASRPAQGQRERAYAILSLRSVSGVTFFETERLVPEIKALTPDIYAKAGDYSPETIDQDERAALEEVGADIRFLPFLEGFGTTRLLKRIKSLPEA